MIRGTKRGLSPTVVHKVEKTFESSIHNRFDIEVVDASTGEVKQRAYAENIILNNLWTKLLGSPYSVWNQYISYGSGTGTLSASRTDLFTRVADVVANKDGSTTKRGLYSYRQKAIISETASNGVTITEVGISYGGAGCLCTHAMLKDMNGNQISILKTNTDIINLFSTVFIHYNPDGYNGIQINNRNSYSQAYPDTYGFLIYLAKGYYNQTSTPPQYFWYGCSNQITDSYEPANLTTSYDVANKTMKFTGTRIGAGSWNTNNNKSTIMLANNQNRYAAAFLRVGEVWPAGFTITGEAIGTGNGTTKDFKTAFPEVSGMKLYTNGVEITSGFTIDENLPFMVSNATPPHNNSMFNRLSMDSDGGIYYDNADGGYVTSYQYLSRDETRIYENYWHERMGLGSVCIYSSVDVQFSNDGTNWVNAPAGLCTGSLVSVPEEYRHYRYIKGHTSINSQRFEIGLERTTDYNIHFTTPPENGTVITADYTTKSIPKDSNHVFDFSCTIKLGEKTT